MRKDKKEFTLDVVSGIDEEIVDRNLTKRYKLWQRRGKSGRIALISAIAAVLCLAVLGGAVIMMLPDGKQVPVYQGMTVSNQAPVVPESTLALPTPVASVLSTSNTLPAYGLVPLGEQETLETQAETEGETEPIIFGKTYYALKNEDIYIHIHISNPDGFEIVSFTLNGVKYSNYMFEPGSDLETLILKYNVGDVDGLQEYTIDAIKYIDGETIKDVRMEGDKTVKVYVNDDTQALSFMTETEFTTLRVTPVWDESFTGDKTIQTLALYEGEELLRELSPTDTEITDLPMGARLVLVATYRDGDTVKTLRQIFDTPKYSEGLIIADGVITDIGSCDDTVLYLNHPIADKAFSEVQSIQEVYMGPGVTSVGQEAFAYCTNLRKVICSENTVTLGRSVFSNCESLKNIVLSPNLVEIPEDGFLGCSSLESLMIPDGVTKIGASAFAISGLKTITVPDSVTQLATGSFRGCHSLESVELPKYITSIDSSVFEHCGSLKSIVLPEGITSIQAYAFQECTGLESIELPVSLTSIGEFAFDRCEGLASIRIPEGVEEIMEGVFGNCTSLKSVELPNGIVSIGYCAFIRCSSLESIVIPEQVEAIGSYAFLECVNLKSVTYGKNLQYLDVGAFQSCPISDMYFNGTRKEWNEGEYDQGFNIHNFSNSLTIHCTDGEIVKN